MIEFKTFPSTLAQKVLRDIDLKINRGSRGDYQAVRLR